MKLNTKRTILVGLAFLSISAFWQLYDSIIPLILKNTFHISDTISGGIMANMVDMLSGIPNFLCFRFSEACPIRYIRSWADVRPLSSAVLRRR